MSSRVITSLNIFTKYAIVPQSFKVVVHTQSAKVHGSENEGEH